MVRSIPVLTVVVVALLAGCGGGGGKRSATATTATKTVLPAPVGSGCASVPAALLARIAKNLTLTGATLTKPRAVASSQLHGVWFVSARVHGGGAGANAVATWATRSLTGGEPIFAVDGLAKMISAFAGGERLKRPIDMRVRGAEQSRSCVAKTQVGA